MSYNVLKHNIFSQFAPYLRTGEHYFEIKTYFVNARLHIDFEGTQKNVIVIRVNNNILSQSTPCRLLKIYTRYEENYCLHLQWTPKLEGVFSSKSSGNLHHTTRLHISKKSMLHSHCREKPKISAQWFFGVLLFCKIGHLQQFGYIKMWILKTNWLLHVPTVWKTETVHYRSQNVF
jgi:hypothetical protein